MKTALAQIGILCLSTFIATAAAPGGQRGAISASWFGALRKGDAALIAKSLKEGADANAVDAAGNTALMLAAAYGDSRCLELLIKAGADVNATNRAGGTALMRAAGDCKKIGIFLTHGAKTEPRSALGNSALMLAARVASNDQAVKALLLHGADAKATNHFGANALMAAAASGDHESARLLLAAGADANAQPGIGDPEFIFGGGRNALCWAAFRGDLKMIQLLLNAGADVNIPSMLGTPLSQSAWADRTAAAKLLVEHGAKVNQPNPHENYTALHWAASSECLDASLVKFLLSRGADASFEGGQNVDAFMDVAQTPLMLARNRGQTPIVTALMAAGAANGTTKRVNEKPDPLANLLTPRQAIEAALPPLQFTSIKSKEAFVTHASHQDCTSCHQQYLPMVAIGFAKKLNIKVDAKQEAELINIVSQGELKMFEADWEPLFHPDAVCTKGYTLFGLAAENIAADEMTDAAVHHLASIQSKEGRWYNNLPRPPIQSGDVSATALAIHALQKYPLPGRKAEFAERVNKARKWLWTVKAENNDAQVFQILGLAWAGESGTRLRPLVEALMLKQKPDGGWAQLPSLEADAYATGQALYALNVAGNSAALGRAIAKGQGYLLHTQLADGTWHVHRRAFPFQPTMKSGFPHGRDSWISAAGSSWAVIALSLPVPASNVALGR